MSEKKQHDETMTTTKDDVEKVEQKEASHEAVASKPVSSTESTTRPFFVALALLLIILLAIFLVPRFFSEEEPQTLSDLHQMVLEEEADTETAYIYNGYSFVYYDGLWYTQVLNQYGGELYDIPLHYGPRELSDVTVTGNLNSYFTLLGNNSIESEYVLATYLTFDPEDEHLGYVALATGELTQNLATTFGLAFIPACTQEGDGCESVPIVTCENTTDPVLFLTSGEPTAVYADENCIVLQGNEEELVRAVDRFILKLYNVMI